MFDQYGSFATTNLARGFLPITVAAIGITGTTLPWTPQPLSDQILPWENLTYSASTVVVEPWQDWTQVLSSFAQQLLDETVDPDPEFDQILWENFWDLA